MFKFQCSMLNEYSNAQCSMIVNKLLKIVNCKLIIASEGGV